MPSQLSNWLGQHIPGMSHLHGLPLVVLVAVATLTLCFVIGYAIKGAQTAWQLTRAVRRLRALGASKPARAADPIDPAAVRAVMVGGALRHLWAEYEDSLHRQDSTGDERGIDRPGSRSPARVRATMPAEAFFTREALVDNRLFDDFTRHLPGVLTGLGIIGTFAGLLDGLSAFDASNTATAVAGLKPLLDGVAHAFSVSALAIGCAMFVTFSSRLGLAALYRQVEALTQTIDGLYASGAGEEYLSRLVASTENAGRHADQLKAALVEELTEVMTTLAERQIDAQRATQQAIVEQLGDRLGNQIGEAVGDRVAKAIDQQLGARFADAIGERLASALAVPMNQLGQLARTMKNAQAERPVASAAPAIDGATLGATIEAALTRGLERFEQGIDRQLSQRIASPLAALQQQFDRTLAGMSDAQVSMQAMAQQSQQANEQIAERMQGSLEETMRQSVTAQTLLLEELRSFVAHLDHTRQQADAQDQARSVKLATHTRQLVGGLTSQVEDLLKTVAHQGSHTQRHIDQLSEMTAKAIGGLNVGAGKLATAAQRLEAAGQAVGGVLNQANATATQLTATAQTLQATATAVQTGFERYDETRRTVNEQVEALTTLIAAVRREAGLSQQMLGDLERIIGQLKVAEAQSQQYLEGVNRALVRSFEEFGGALTNQLRNTIGDTDRHLSSGVQQLNGVVQHIGMTLSRMRAN